MRYGTAVTDISQSLSSQKTSHSSPVWVVFCENFGENWPCYSGTAPHWILKQNHMVVAYFPWYFTRRPAWKPRPREWFPCWVAEWSIMENMQQQMWFCFYPSPISINISSYVYNALRLTPEIWFWAMPFASFQIDINKYLAIVSPRCQVISNCDVMSPWITWQNNRLMISRFAILSREYLLQTVLCNQ